MTSNIQHAAIWGNKSLRSAVLYLAIFACIALHKGPGWLFRGSWTAWLYAGIGAVWVISQFADWVAYVAAFLVAILVAALMPVQSFWGLFTFSLCSNASMIVLLVSVMLEGDSPSEGPRYIPAAIGVGLALAGLLYGVFVPAPSTWIQAIHDLSQGPDPRVPPAIVPCLTICTSGVSLFIVECAVCLPFIFKVLDRFGWLLAPLTLLVAAFNK
jgi:hypothetical protein